MSGDPKDKLLARSFFEEPRWTLSQVLAWIAFRNIDALTASYEDIQSLRFSSSVYGINGNALVIKHPLAELQKALREGKIAAIGRDHINIASEFWDELGLKRETWPNVRFPRVEVLALYPTGQLPIPAKLASTNSTPLSQAQTDSAADFAKQTLAKRVAEELLRLYGDQRPPKNRKEIIRDLEAAGRTGKISQQTLTRAFQKIGWVIAVKLVRATMSRVEPGSSGS